MKKIKVELTPSEYSILIDILNSTKDCLEWDEGLQEYTDGGRFMISFTKGEYKTLNNIRL